MNLNDVMADLHAQLDSLRPELMSVLRERDRIRIGLYVGTDGVGDIQTKRLPCIDKTNSPRILSLQI